MFRVAIDAYPSLHRRSLLGRAGVAVRAGWARGAGSGIQREPRLVGLRRRGEGHPYGPGFRGVDRSPRELQYRGDGFLGSVGVGRAR